MSATIPLIYPDSESFNTSFLALELPALIEKMKEKSSWKKGDLNTMILLDSPARKIMLTIIHKGTEIMSLQANDSITFHVLEGKLLLHIRQGSVTINKGEIFILYEKTKYSINSMEETSFLLTVAS
jgi:quercetin dioxygenase-like cupin family protein